MIAYKPYINWCFYWTILCIFQWKWVTPYIFINSQRNIHDKFKSSRWNPICLAFNTFQREKKSIKNIYDIQHPNERLYPILKRNFNPICALKPTKKNQHHGLHKTLSWRSQYDDTTNSKQFVYINLQLNVCSYTERILAVGGVRNFSWCWYFNCLVQW